MGHQRSVSEEKKESSLQAFQPMNGSFISKLLLNTVHNCVNLAVPKIVTEAFFLQQNALHLSFCQLKEKYRTIVDYVLIQHPSFVIPFLFSHLTFV